MNQLTHKLYHFEEAPPGGSWAAIADALDHQSAPVAEKLHQFQQAPPTGIWDHIELALKEDTTAPVVSFTQKHKKLFKYISAAAVLVLVASLITIYLTKSSGSPEMGLQNNGETEVSEPHNALTPPSTDSGNNTQPNSDDELNASSEKEKQPVERTTAKSNGKQARYITVAVESGKKIRLSKKAYTVFDCAENGAAQKSERCKENIEAMQQKMAASMLSPSGDFGGLIDILKSLEENE